MKLNYVIDDLDGYEYAIDFEFHKECEGEIVFDGAWTIISITDGWLNNIKVTTAHDEVIKRWLSKFEYKIYNEAERQFGVNKYAL